MPCLCIHLIFIVFQTFIFMHADFSYFEYNLGKVVVASVLWKLTELSSHILTFSFILIQFSPFSQDAVFSLKYFNAIYSSFFTLSVCLIKESPLCCLLCLTKKYFYFCLPRIHFHFWVYTTWFGEDRCACKCDFHIPPPPTLPSVEMAVGGWKKYCKKYFIDWKSLS